MSLLGDCSTSFIVRIWRERGEGPRAEIEWRGSVECVESGERMYFKDLNRIRTFLETQVRRIGIDAAANARPEDTGPDGDGSSRAGPTAKKRRGR
jgi:hypothetical protein